MISGPTLHMGEVGIVYEPVTLKALGGKDPLLWKVSHGAMPAGLSISSDGVLTGAPGEMGTFSFTVEVTDATMATARAGASITVVPRLTAYLVSSGTTEIKQGSTATGVAFGNKTGGLGPFGYAVTSGSLPAGTSMEGLSLRGSFNSAGNYRFTATVTDALGASAGVNPSYYVWASIAFPPDHCATTQCTADRHYDASLHPYGFDTPITGTYTYTGGTPGSVPEVSFGSAFWGGISGTCSPGGCQLNGVTVTAANGVVTVTVAGGQNPNLPRGSWWHIWVRLTDPVTRESTRSAVFLVSS